MVKIKLSESERNLFQGIFNMLNSGDPESQRLGFSLAKEEINFNIGIKYHIRSTNAKNFFSINDLRYLNYCRNGETKLRNNLLYILDVILDLGFYYL